MIVETASGSEEAPLPPLYAPWLRAVSGGPIPRETVATCDRCVMLPAEGQPPGAEFFLPAVKCCAYQPTLPGFLAGRILGDADPTMAYGRRALERQIERRVGVVPGGVKSGAVFNLLFTLTPNVFGRAPDLKCPYLTDGGDCGVWRHRPGVCATWFCKHVRGETGFRFWRLADKLFRAVESDLSLWCAAKMNLGKSELRDLDPVNAGRPHVSELGGPVDAVRYRELWGNWEGREKEFYRAAAALVEPLAWNGVLAICGPRVTILSELVRDAYEHLVSDALPDRLRLATFAMSGAADGKYRVESYSPYDPALVPEELVHALRYFDGRPTEEALTAILTERNLRVDLRLVRRLVDFGLLKTEPDVERNARPDTGASGFPGSVRLPVR
ncbi:MAG: hypothetical protein ABI584_08560 [Acidobacteriota bacterium]